MISVRTVADDIREFLTWPSVKKDDGDRICFLGVESDKMDMIRLAILRIGYRSYEVLE
jgi:hypothetical protein